MTKAEIRKAILTFLEVNPRTQVAAIRSNIEAIMESRNEIGEMTEPFPGGQRIFNVRISDDDALFINEVIYDLIVERILTPGIDASNLDWPWIHVNDVQKLKNKIDS